MNSRPLKKRFEEKIDKAIDAPCWDWTASVDGNGYGKLYCNGKLERASRVSWLLHVGPIPLGACVLHKCDRPICVNPDHLYLGDQKQNAADRSARGRLNHQVGEKTGNAKLVSHQIPEIRDLLKNGLSPLAVAEQFNVSRHTIYGIRNGTYWRHL